MQEVLSLITHDQDEAPLNNLFGVAAKALFDDESLVGQRLGAYQVTATIGRGGMGTVYLAVRADDTFRKQVAIKVVKGGLDTRAMLGRFRQERQILANLDHPNIARMLDAGSTTSQRPFLVMEYVDGRPIDEYCRDHNLNVEQKCRLFLEVCAAVAYAHRSLVVHRDLKPSNILVTPEGQPKLVDFGVAKLLIPEQDPDLTLTQAGLRPLTPHYSSPEVFQGFPPTTAADIYSLGAVFYEVLTNTRPHEFHSGRPDEWMRVVCETEIRRPEVICPDLSLDLARILSMALRKEPERRYTSAEQLAEDIERYLQGRPVRARGDAFGYRWSKFVRRNRVWLAAGALAAGSVLTGTVVAVESAREANSARRDAEHQRQLAEERLRQVDAARQLAESEHESADIQRQLAVLEAERARKEERLSAQRLTDMVELANRSLYDVHNSIARLPGAMAARQELVRTTIAYLENLSASANGDPRLQLALARAYFRLGSVQSSVGATSLGDIDGALRSYYSAARWLRSFLRVQPANQQTLELEIDLGGAIGSILVDTGRGAEGRTMFESLVPKTRELARLNPSDGRGANLEGKLATAYRSNPAAALMHALRAAGQFALLAAANPNDPDLLWGESISNSLAGSAHLQLGNVSDALRHFRRSLEIREQLAERDPANQEYRRSLTLAYGQVSDVLSRPDLGAERDGKRAFAYLLRAADLARATYDADPRNSVAKFDLAAVELRVASAALSPESKDVRLGRFRHSVQLLNELAAAEPRSVRYWGQLSLAGMRLGAFLRAQGQPNEAIAAYRQGLAASETYLSIEPRQSTAAEHALEELRSLAELLAEGGDGTGAQGYLGRALELAAKANYGRESLRAQALAATYTSAARVEMRLGRWAEASANAEQAVARWREVEAASTQLSAAMALLTECRQRLGK